jgi:transcription termination/antitermination protein NusG
MSVDEKKWYVVRVVTGYEKKVEAALTLKAKELGLTEHFGRCLYPSEELVEMKGGKKRQSKRLFYPGYMLMEMALSDDVWHTVSRLNHVLGFVGGSRGNPVPLGPKEVQDIMDRIEQQGEDKPKPRVLYQVGEVIRIVEGPFADFNGVVESINYEKSRLRVSVVIFGRSTPVDLEFGQVEKESNMG